MKRGRERQIDLVSQDIRPYDPMFANTDDEVTFNWELHMDVDKYFGTDTKDNENVELRFYTTYHKRNNKITAKLMLDNRGSLITDEWELTDEETKFIKEKLDLFCIEDSGLPLKQWFDERIKQRGYIL